MSARYSTNTEILSVGRAKFEEAEKLLRKARMYLDRSREENDEGKRAMLEQFARDLAEQANDMRKEVDTLVKMVPS
jgi:hypothetical protein